ncbi:hypothetical protein ACRRTK_010249 [Alexandromys fortis]
MQSPTLFRTSDNLHFKDEESQCFFHHHGIPHSIASYQGTHFTAREVPHGTLLMEFYHIPQHLKAAGLLQQWNNDLWKTQVQHHLGGSGLAGCGRVSSRLYIL